jgi:hypothetical protein
MNLETSGISYSRRILLVIPRYNNLGFDERCRPQIEVPPDSAEPDDGSRLLKALEITSMWKVSTSVHLFQRPHNQGIPN